MIAKPVKAVKNFSAVTKENASLTDLIAKSEFNHACNAKCYSCFG